MRSLWVTLDSRGEATRILAMVGPKETVLKARLSSVAQHPRAVPTLLESLAMWHGIPVRAVVVVDDQERSSATRLKLGWLADFAGEPLYTLKFVDGRRRRHRDQLDGLGEFQDLRQLTIFEVAR